MPPPFGFQAGEGVPVPGGGGAQFLEFLLEAAAQFVVLLPELLQGGAMLGEFRLALGEECLVAGLEFANLGLQVAQLLLPGGGLRDGGGGGGVGCRFDRG